MFDKLIDSAPGRPRRRFLGFFFGTSMIYLLAITAALAVSVLITNPKLAHTSDLHYSTRLAPPPKRGNPDTRPAKQQSPQRQTQPDIYNPVPLEQAAKQVAAEPTTDRSNNPPTTTRIEGAGIETGLESGDPDSRGFIPGIGTERRVLPDTTAPPPPPVDASKQPKKDDQSPLRLPSTVLQGKALDRRTPAYPRMAMVAHVEGPVSVEVVISPEGRVEVARAVSGHPLLKPAADMLTFKSEKNMVVRAKEMIKSL
jgi:hypothetical protein